MGCADGFAFSSGQAATVTMMHTLKAGDHVVSIDDVYAGTQQYFTYVLPECSLFFCCDEVCVPAGALPHRMGTVCAIEMGDVPLMAQASCWASNGVWDHGVCSAHSSLAALGASPFRPRRPVHGECAVGAGACLLSR